MVLEGVEGVLLVFPPYPGLISMKEEVKRLSDGSEVFNKFSVVAN